MLRRFLVTVAVAAVVCLAGSARWASAQAGLGFANGGVDPFSVYFGYYLPHQAYVAAQPTPLDTINQITAARQFAAIQDRQGLYDPISPYGEEELDPNRPFSGKRGTEKVAKPQLFPVTTALSTSRGIGPTIYYGRTARYYPQIRVGRGSNKNLAVTRSRTGSGFGGGFGGGFAGPR